MAEQEEENTAMAGREEEENTAMAGQQEEVNTAMAEQEEEENTAMAEQEEEEENPTVTDETHKLELPTQRVKRIMKLDKDIKRVNSEAIFLIASSTELFLQFLAEKSALAAMEKKKRTIRVEHMRVATKRHRPTADFLLDSLPMPTQPSEQNLPKDKVKSKTDKKPVPFATKSIDAFFQKST